MSWARIGSGRLAMRTAATKAVLDNIRPSLTDGPGPSGAARGAVSEPREGAREARSSPGLRIRLFGHAYNETVARSLFSVPYNELCEIEISKEVRFPGCGWSHLRAQVPGS